MAQGALTVFNRDDDKDPAAEGFTGIF